MNVPELKAISNLQLNRQTSIWSFAMVVSSTDHIIGNGMELVRHK
jgi:hypothetical protein